MLYSSIFTFSMVFVRKSVTRLPFIPLQGQRNDATGFTLCYGLLFCTCFSQAYLASTQSVTQKHWRLATRLTGDYLGQTLTGKLITACRTHDFHPLETCAARRTIKKLPARQSCRQKWYHFILLCNNQNQHIHQLLLLHNLQASFLFP